jgi:hypothetical protein
LTIPHRFDRRRIAPSPPALEPIARLASRRGVDLHTRHEKEDDVAVRAMQTNWGLNDVNKAKKQHFIHAWSSRDDKLEKSRIE